MIPELLVPAGDMDAAKAAINGGADAIYLGGKNFSARNFAKNFTEEELESLIDYASLRGVKIYITINTLYTNEEMPRVLEFANKMYKIGASAFILQDIGLAHLLKNNLPEIELHASTQMTVHSTDGVKFMEKAGFSRVILSRELSLAEISQINKEVNIATEVFVHGALCVSYSGQCLLSSLVGQRSGNRGKCAQPCRLPYDLLKNNEPIKKGHLLSPKDMMTLEILGDVIKTGVSALKIEGRMKSPEYVYVVTKAYRDQLDNMKPKIDKSTINDVTQIFNRGGSFSTGYYNTYGDISMMSTETPKSTGVFCGTVINYKKGKCTIRFSEKMIPGDGIEIWTSKGANVGTGIAKAINDNETAIITIEGNIDIGNDVYKSYDKRLTDETKKIKSVDIKKTSIIGSIEAQIGKPIKLTLKYKTEPPRENTNTIIVESYSKSIVEKALKAPMDKDEIIKQLSKTGNSPFVIKFENANIDEDIFISKLVLNEVRRDAVEALEKEIVKASKRLATANFQISKIPATDIQSPKLTVQIKDIDNLDAILEHNVSRIYIDFNEKNIAKIENLSKEQDCHPEIFLALPPISRNEHEESIKSRITKLEDTNLAGYLVATYGQLNILQDLGSNKKIILDHNFNIFNNWSKIAFKNFDGTTLSQELTVAQLKNIDAQKSEIIVHGRQVLMSLHNCPIGLYSAEKKGKHCSNKFTKDKFALLDRKDVQFPIVTDCDNCIAYVLNSKILDTAAKFNEIKSTGIEYLRLIFRDDNEKKIKDTIKKYEELLSGSNDINIRKDINCTYGHFFRGVE
ncbi:MAG: U32 family peptidase [Defluviitaleaceae bacterium]|nr:U32 family peptidase [Defluviitaleaceae bacterium]